MHLAPAGPGDPTLAVAVSSHPLPNSQPAPGPLAEQFLQQLHVVHRIAGNDLGRQVATNIELTDKRREHLSRSGTGSGRGKVRARTETAPAAYEHHRNTIQTGSDRYCEHICVAARPRY